MSLIGEGPSLDLPSLRLLVAAGHTPTYRFFWGHQPASHGRLTDACFSQWWACNFELRGHGYTSAEQWMMASKARLFGDAKALAAILRSTSPSEAKALGRKVQGFDEGRWAAARFDLVTEGNVAKFGQDATLDAYLAGTGDDILVEASPTDPIWGIGLAAADPRALDPREWLGLNQLGFALMRARAILGGSRSLRRS
jgi:ribA/ribD-fused uncharacterized protein